MPFVASFCIGFDCRETLKQQLREQLSSMVCSTGIYLLIDVSAVVRC